MGKLRPVPDTPPRAVAYIRVSDEGGRGDRMVSPQIQLTAIKDHCARRGYELVAALEDIDKSGKFWKRRQVEQAIAMLEQGTAEVVVVWKVSRVARNRLDWAVAVDRVETAGGQLESATEAIDPTTSTGRFTRGMLAELAAFESERIGESWKETHRQRLESGRPHHGRPKLGYLYDGTYTPDPVTAPMVVEAYRRAVDSGNRSATRFLQTSGHPYTERGARYLLDGGFAAGLLWLNSEHTHLPGTHQPIITPKLWDAYVLARKERAGIPPRHKNPVSRLTGLVICEGCGRPMQYFRSGPRPPAFYCRGDGTLAPLCPARARVREDAAEAAVLGWLPDVARSVGAVKPAVRKANTDRLQRVVVGTEAALTNLVADFARRIIPEAAYLTTRDALTAELENTRLEIARQATDSVPAAVTLLDLWQTRTPQVVNLLARALFRVHVLRAEVGHPIIVVRGLWD